MIFIIITNFLNNLTFHFSQHEVIRLLFFCLLGVLSFNTAKAQDILNNDFNTVNNKGKFFVFWGWNRADYSKSDIHFKGVDHDLLFDKVIATDAPTPWDASIYLNPALITIPQTNFKIGYFINDHYNLSFGVDHMKYVVVQNQEVLTTGYIDREGSNFNGLYDNTPMVLTEDFLMFEHTDGLNYINIELTRFDNILVWFHKGQKNLEINLLEGVGIGALLPKTKMIFMEGKWYDDFHLSGFGLNLKVGLNITFFKYFFIQGELKGGYINMPDIRYSFVEVERATQSFMFTEIDFLFGVKFKIANKNK